MGEVFNLAKEISCFEGQIKVNSSTFMQNDLMASVHPWQIGLNSGLQCAKITK